MPPPTNLKMGGLIVDQASSETKTPDWCQTRINCVVHYLRLLWMAPGVRQSDNSNSSLTSPKFSLGSNGINANLTIQCLPCHPKLYLKVPPEHEARVFGRIRMSTALNILDTDHKVLSWEPYERLFCKANVDDASGWKLECRRASQMNCKTRSYYIRAEIEVILLDNGSGDSTVSKLSHDFGALQVQMDKDPIGHWTDVVLQIGTTVFGAHKFVLSARSPVLKAMLTADMAEARSGVIEMKEMSVEAAQDLIGFIYSGRIDRQRLVGTAEELLQVATMYEMPDLKAICETALCEAITANNTAQFLLIASLHGSAMLKAATLAYLASNKSAVTQTEEWVEAMALQPKILLEAVLEII